MEDFAGQHLIDGTAAVEVTRREALEKMGKYGLYVPATLAVLTAAPRAFAQSPTSTTFRGTVYIQGSPSPVAGANVGLYLPTNHLAASGQRPPDYTATTNQAGQYEIVVPQAVSGQVQIEASTSAATSLIPTPASCYGNITPTVHPGLNTGLDITMQCN